MGIGCENLECWQKAKNLAVEIYKLSSNGNLDSDPGFREKLGGAAVAVATHIAEGRALGSPSGFIRSLRMAKASAAGLRTQLLISREIGYLGEGDYLDMEDQVNRIQAMIGGLIKAVRNKAAEPKTEQTGGVSKNNGRNPPG